MSIPGFQDAGADFTAGVARWAGPDSIYGRGPELAAARCYPGSTPDPKGLWALQLMAAGFCTIFLRFAWHLPPCGAPFHRTPLAVMQNLCLKRVFLESR